MTDFESNGNQTISTEPSSDNLSLKNWAVPDEPIESQTYFSNRLADLVPSYIKDLCKGPKTAELRVSYDSPTSQTTYVYCITWEDDEDAQERYAKILDASSSKEKLKTSESFSSTKGPPAPVDATCDGPCKKLFPSNLLSTIGRCGHYLCTACFGLIKNADGTNGCSSQQCYWKGESREETKKNYEKEICRKQRAKARDMNKRGIDVKPASESSGQDISKSGSSSSSSETNCSVTSGPYSSIPEAVPPSPPTRVKLVLVEPNKEYGILHTYAERKIKPHQKLGEALEALLARKKKKAKEYLPHGVLYYGMLNDDQKLGMRHINPKYYDEMNILDVPKMDNRIILILDMGNFVKNGVKVYMD